MLWLGLPSYCALVGADDHLALNSACLKIANLVLEECFSEFIISLCDEFCYSFITLFLIKVITSWY